MELRRQILQDRESRFALQQRLVKQSRRPLLSFTLNVPGDDKRTPLAQAALHKVWPQFLAWSAPQGLPVDAVQYLDLACGYAMLATVHVSAMAAKQVGIAFEQSHAIGRLCDIDIMDIDGSYVKRTALGSAPRRCLVCGEDFWVCRRQTRHPEVLALVTRMLSDYVQATT